MTPPVPAICVTCGYTLNVNCPTCRNRICAAPKPSSETAEPVAIPNVLVTALRNTSQSHVDAAKSHGVTASHDEAVVMVCDELFALRTQHAADVVEIANRDILIRAAMDAKNLVFDDLDRVRAAMVKARNELAGVGPNSSKEFHGMGICSALSIIDAALQGET